MTDRLGWGTASTASYYNLCSKEIELNLSHWDNSEAGELILNGAFYLVEGMVDNLNNTFHVTRMWSPPVAQTRSYN